jgi:hypothetical protein
MRSFVWSIRSIRSATCGGFKIQNSTRLELSALSCWLLLAGFCLVYSVYSVYSVVGIVRIVQLSALSFQLSPIAA